MTGEPEDANPALTRRTQEALVLRPHSALTRRAVTFLLLVLAVAACAAPAATPDNGAVHLARMSFLDPSRGWVAASECPPRSAGACRVRVYRTEDGGATWAQAARFFLSPSGLSFADAHTGWLVGSIGTNCGSQTCPNVIMLTKDGGLTWDRVSTVSVELVDVAAVSASNVWALGGLCTGQPSCPAMLLKTASAGQTWASQNLPIDGRAFQIQRLGTLTSLVGGITSAGARISTTRDDGAVWQSLAPPCQGQAGSFAFRSAAEGWYVCAGAPGGARSGLDVLHTADGGKTWTTLARIDAESASAVPTPAAGTTAIDRVSVAFPSSEVGWIASNSGLVRRSADGGKTWTTAFDAKERVEQIQFVDPTHGWILGTTSVWRTADGGGTWQRVAIAGANWPTLPTPPRHGSVE